MQLLLSKSQDFRRSVTTGFLVLAVAYFGFHAISGDRGLLALAQLTKEVEVAQGELDRVRAERLHLEHRVSLLKDESLDIDLLDEQARKVLGFGLEGERVLLVK